MVNGPNTHFEGKSLRWKFEGFEFEYSPTDICAKVYKEDFQFEGQRICTGTLSFRMPEEKSIEFEETWKYLWDASQVLSFAAGRRVGIGHVEPIGSEYVQSFMLGFSRPDIFQKVGNWYDIEMVQDFSDFAAKYMNFLLSEPKERPLRYSTDFYRASNVAERSSRELALISSLSALEVLVHYILRNSAGWSSDLLQRSKLADKIRAVMAFVGLEASPLEHASHLKRKLKRFDSYDAYSAITEARNSIIHAEKSFHLSGLELQEVWRLSQWLVEILTFHLIGYDGLMADRRRMTGWRGEGTGKVPLAR